MITKKLKLCYDQIEDKDEIREMMIASAKYANCLSAVNGSAVEVAIPSKQVRVRRRLDDLTPDEKLKRKKLKNREAAQTSRDKKKAYVNDLETTVKTLRIQNDSLMSQVLLLLSEKEELIKKAERLEKELKMAKEGRDNSGSAVPAIPLQKEKTSPLLVQKTGLHSTTMTACWIWMTFLGLMTSPIHPTSKSLKRLQTLSANKLKNWRTRCLRLRQWWGPNQKAWNPIAAVQMKLLLKKSMF
ncbi:X-box-binding protein 1 [Cimex lectularius]|uniref:X-box-binding protein 1 n=1 Tax=Cimex lectularius TaxID=79782 RepID=A0A8I6RI41_CIMLE|nr:X-box-binding protein 1 [Cimex lectularius]